MAEPPINKVTIREWTGLVSNRGPFAGKVGDAKVQVNVRSVQPGVLEVRNGLRPVKWGS